MERFTYHLTRPFYGDYTYEVHTQDEIEEESPRCEFTLALQTHCTLFGTAAPRTIAGLTWWRTGIFCALDPLENQMCGRTEPVGGE